MWCCFQRWYSAVTSTISGSVATSKVIEACFIHSERCLSGNSSAKIAELTKSWWPISRTVRTNAVLDNGGLPLVASMTLLRRARSTPAVSHTVNWPPFASLWIDPHPTACGFMFLLLPVLQTIFKCASWIICLVAALAASRLTNLYLHSCGVPRISIFDIAPANLPIINPLLPGGRSSVCIMCCCGIEDEDDNDRKLEPLSNI